MASLPQPAMSELDYLRIERAATSKSEFHDGQMLAMPGGSYRHSRLSVRLTALLEQKVPAGCATFNSDLRIKVNAAGLYTYADGGVVCGEPQFADGEHDALLNPMLIIEVLSPSSTHYDRGGKFELYRTIESFCEYLVVHQDRPHIEYHSRQPDGSWLLREHLAEDAVLCVDRLQLSLPLSEIYSTLG